MPDSEMDRAYRDGSARAARALVAQAALEELRVDFEDALRGDHFDTLLKINALIKACKRVQDQHVGAWN